MDSVDFESMVCVCVVYGGGVSLWGGGGVYACVSVVCWGRVVSCADSLVPS